MMWVYAIVVDLGAMAAFTILILHGHPYASIIPALVSLTFTIKTGKAAK